MLIAIPLAGEKLSAHFGHCDKFAIIEVDEQSKSVLSRRDLSPPAHQPGVLPKWLNEMGVQMILAGGIGRRAQQIFRDNDIKVIVGAPPEDPEKLAAAYLEGNLQTGDNICDH